MLKLATILFADVVDSTWRAETRDPEVVHAQMSDFFEAMVNHIIREGGTIEKFIGDAIMAVFGVPTSHEDDPVRAVRAARSMLSELDEWNSVRHDDERLQLRIGINTGRVLAAGEPGDNLLVTGDPVNVAARLQAIAAPGSIVIGERTAGAASGRYMLKTLGPQFLKGRTEPVSAFEVLSEKAQDEASVSHRAPLVGRVTELQLVATVFNRVLHQQEPHLVLLTGEAGIGKSRLALEISQRLDASGANLLVGRCLAQGQGQSLAPLAEILRRATGIVTTDPPRSVMSKIEALVAETSPGTAAQVNFAAAALAVTLGVHPDDDPLREIDPREVYRLLANAWRALLSGLARTDPLLVVIEDVHWADDVLRQLVGELVERTVGQVLFLCTARPDEMRGSPFASDILNLVTLPLQPLDDTERAAMAKSLLGTDRLPEGLRSVVERSEGNPFFLEEIIRHLNEEELLQKSVSWVLSDGSTAIDLPDNVEGVIVSRLDSLDSFDKRVLQQAAVVGRFFWPGALMAAMDSDRLEGSLRALERRQLIVERLTSSMEGETEYAFKHALIRDVAYEGLPRAIRGTAHARIGGWLMQKVGDRFEELPEPLAHHFSSAFKLMGGEELRLRARDLSMRAAAAAAQRFSLQEAARFGADAVELSRDAERAEALEALGDVHNPHAGDAAWKAYLEALEQWRATEDADVEAVARLAAKASVVATRWQGMMEDAPSAADVASVIELGLEHAPAGDARARCLLLSARAWAQIQGYEERDDAGRRAASEALEIARRIDDADLISSILDATSLWELTERRFGNMARIIDERLQLVPRLTDVTEVCDVYAMAAWNSTFIGHYRTAIARATECVERAEGVDAGAFQHGLVWRTSARFMAGDWDGCLQDQEQIERVQNEDARDLPPPYVMRPYGFAALCHELRGETDHAERYLMILRRFHADRDMPVNLIGSRAPMCRALAHKGELEEARSLLRLEPSQFLCIHLEAWTDVVAGMERWDEAREMLPMARAEAERGELIALGYFLDRLEGRVAASEADTERARILLRGSAEGFERLGAPWEQSNSLLHLATVSEPSEVRSILDAATATFEGLRSVAELETCARLREELGTPIA